MKIEKLKLIIINNIYSIILGVCSTVYGLQIFFNPVIMETYAIYRYIRLILNHQGLGGILIVLGLAKLIGVFFNLVKLRQYALILLGGSWSFLLVSFAITTPPNTVWANALVMMLLCVAISVRGNFK